MKGLSDDSITSLYEHMIRFLLRLCAYAAWRLTLVVQLEEAQAPLWCRAVVDRQRVGGTADHLTFHQQRVVGQNQRGALIVHAPDGQLLAVRQVHVLHLGTQEVNGEAVRHCSNKR